MESLIDRLNSIATNDCRDREEAKRDILSAISMDSDIVIENFLATWVDLSDQEVQNLSQGDQGYRQFILEFEEV